MDPRSTQQALDVSAPLSGAVPQITMLAATAFAATDTGVDGSATGVPPQYFTWLSPVEFYIIFGPTSGLAAPVIGAASAWGPIPAGVPADFRVDTARRFFRVISTAGGSLVWRASSGPGL